MANTSTKQFVAIQEIYDDLIILKDSSLRQIIEVNSMNFELRSESEQLAILKKFKEFLNSLDFSLEILIISRKLNLNEYLKTLNELVERQENELFRIYAAEYLKFIKELTQLSNIMSKNFFVIVPFYISLIKPAKGIKSIFQNIFKPSEAIKKLTPEEINIYKNQIKQRTNLVIDGLISLGLRPKVLQKEEIINLFYKLYNPKAIEWIYK